MASNSNNILFQANTQSIEHEKENGNLPTYLLLGFLSFFKKIKRKIVSYLFDDNQTEENNNNEGNSNI